MDSKNKHAIVLFDGVCNLCNGAVNFIIQRDQEAVFLFVPMQSAYGQELLKTDKINTDSIQLIKDDRIYIESDAVLEILKDLTGIWQMFRIFKWIPQSIRDALYRFIAKNRYRILGEKDACMIPDPEVIKRFKLE